MEKAAGAGIKKADRKATLIILAVFAAIVTVSSAVFIRFYNSYIDDVLYRERLNQMKEVTTQLFSGLEEVVEHQWEKTDAFCNYIQRDKPKSAEQLLSFTARLDQLNSMETKQAQVVAVDHLGRYLTKDGWQGTLNDMDLLLDMPEKVSFVSKAMTSGDTFVYFLNRLPEPVTIQDGDRTVDIIYYGVAQNMLRFNTYFRCEAYGDSNSVYVLDDEGTRLFHSTSLLRGYNAYTTLGEMEYLHDNSFEEAKQSLDATGRGYANAVLDGEEYYYALYQMEHASWVLLFLVPSDMVATDVVEMVSTTMGIVLIFSLAMLIISSVCIFIVLRIKQKQAIAVEHQNSAKLEQINRELSDAVETAERAEQAAQNASQAKSQFLANMSHDIRTPMNAIVGITKLMEHEKDNPEKLDTYIHKVQSSSQHLLSLINDVLDMSKIESGEVVLNHEQISLANQVAQIESIIRPQAEDRSQDFKVLVQNLIHEFFIGDAVRLRQIFINLLSNAVKYTPNGGKIRLVLEEQPDGNADCAVITITVTDTGYGMTPEFVEHIFDPFTRAENSTTNKVQGTGLGMAITKNIVDMMNGTISVKSEVGKGSSFRVTLPLQIDRGTTEHVVNSEGVLLFSGESDIIRNAKAFFKVSDVPLYTAGTMPELDDVLHRHTVDVVLLSGYINDPKLPELVQYLRREINDSVLIFCAEYMQQEKAAGILERSGVNGLIARPLFLSNFARIVNQVRDEGASLGSDAALKGMRFLCAEDNALNAEILDALMEMVGASCVIYPDGQKLVEAFAVVQPGEFDAILMDVQMPNMNGLEATRAIRSGNNPLGKTIPIIAMTAGAFSSDVQNCLDAGMDAHISKPLDIALLAKTVSHLVTPRVFKP